MVTVRKIPNFKGSFFSWKVNFSTNREKGTSENFVVFSSGRRHSVLKYLWLKLVWDELTQLEFQLLISTSEFLNDDKKVGFLRARLTTNKRILRGRLLQMEHLLGEEISSRETYRGMKIMKIDIQKETIRLAKVPKFSGYVKSISAIGKSQRGAVLPEPVPEAFVEDHEPLNWYEILSVGEFSLLSQKILLPDEDQ